MAYQWDSSLETGYEKIDNQHRQLVSTLNNLIEASEQGKDKDEIFKVLDFLTGYTIMHFKTEEDLQVKYNYPDYYNHRRLHEDFKATVKELSERLVKEGPTPSVVVIVTTTIGEWLVNHIKGDDFRMAAYVKSMDKT
ncbi:MAG: bacteriohemerythrin [Treponema sp.]|jgi:hemerythrin-like metal-binding protein|nr:bacteriohemerythrin [Treponema sp.]